jgi:hypothetical protein
MRGGNDKDHLIGVRSDIPPLRKFMSGGGFFAGAHISKTTWGERNVPPRAHVLCVTLAPTQGLSTILPKFGIFGRFTV